MQNRPSEPPLIVTARLCPESFAVLDALRRRHFPAALNKVPAHVSLFHHLPGAAVETIVETVTALCLGQVAIDLPPRGLRSLGRGVAITYEASGLDPLRAALAREWAAWLTPQDRQPFAPHVTIQNKVAPADARSLFEAMRADPLPACRIDGISIWRYLDGPWESVADCPFVA